MGDVLGGSILGNFLIREKCAPAEAAEVDLELDVASGSNGARDPAGGLDLDGMPLAVVDGQGVQLKTRMFCRCQGCG